MANPKGNPQNLQPFTVKTAKKMGARGGKKAAETKRARKNAKECMNLILSLDTKDDKSKALMCNMGIKDEEQQNIMLLMATMFAKATNTGDPSAIKAILEIAGEIQGEKLQDTPTININIVPATSADTGADEE